jgi:ferredoxin
MANDARLIFRGTDEAEAARRAHEAALPRPQRRECVEANRLRELCLQAGADDVGFVDIGRAGLGAENDNARRLFPAVKALICLVGISNRDAIRSTSRATANYAWRLTGDKLDGTAARICEQLAEVGVRAVPTSMGFPMDVQAPPSQPSWAIAHKVVAVEAGMGHMGTNRNIIHPRLGNFVLLETILIDAEVDTYGQPLDYNPCLGCNLCVAACPVGAISNVGEFDFFACLGHNYREFPFSAADWVDAIAAGDASAYRAKFRDGETLSMVQSLAFEPPTSPLTAWLCARLARMSSARTWPTRPSIARRCSSHFASIPNRCTSSQAPTRSRRPQGTRPSKCAIWTSGPTSRPSRTSPSGYGICSRRTDRCPADFGSRSASRTGLCSPASTTGASPPGRATRCPWMRPWPAMRATT